MSASIELQTAAKQLMGAACAAASAEWIGDAELRADFLAEAGRDIETAQQAIDKAVGMLRRLKGSRAHDKSIIADRSLEVQAMKDAGLIIE